MDNRCSPPTKPQVWRYVCLPRATARVAELRAAMHDWAGSHYGETVALADMVRITADLTLSCASILIDDARKLIRKTIGYPVAVKAAGGGGGKGFRVAESEEKLQEALNKGGGQELAQAQAAAEAQAATDTQVPTPIATPPSPIPGVTGNP